MINVMNYGKARGALLVKEFLPKLNPFQSIDLIQTIDEWELIKSKYGQNMIQRVDYPIGQSKVKRNAVAGTTGFAESIPGLIASVRAQGYDGAVLLMQTAAPSPPRYLYLGAFNILFRLGGEVVMELVGQAFDGHELTQGLACHERYFFAWDEAIFMISRRDLIRRRKNEYLVSPLEYTSQREARVKFLIQECKYPPDEVRQSVPEQFVQLGDTVIKALIEDIILCLLGQEYALSQKGLVEFCVQGNVVEVGGQVQIHPWEIFTPSRWT